MKSPGFPQIVSWAQADTFPRCATISLRNVMAKSPSLASKPFEMIAQGSPARLLHCYRPYSKIGLNMSHAPKIVLQLPISNPALLPSFVDACIRDGVALIAIVGEGCHEIEETIDELVVGDGSGEGRFLVTTSSHPSETVEEVMEFASMWKVERTQAVELVKL
jgi:hypothetical protein